VARSGLPLLIIALIMRRGDAEKATGTFLGAAASLDESVSRNSPYLYDTECAQPCPQTCPKAAPWLKGRDEGAAGAAFGARKGVVNNRSEGFPHTGQAYGTSDWAIERNSRKSPQSAHR